MKVFLLQFLCLFGCFSRIMGFPASPKADFSSTKIKHQTITQPPRFTSLSRALRLHQTARSKIKKGDWVNAKRLYELHLYEWDNIPKGNDDETLDHICVAKTYLLLALHLQRTGDIDGARSAFREGAEKFEADAEQRGCHQCRTEAAQLYLSWGLLESKQDKFEFAWLLVTKAVQLDTDKIPILRWRIWDPRKNPRISRFPDAKKAQDELTQVQRYYERWQSQRNTPSCDGIISYE